MIIYKRIFCYCTIFCSMLLTRIFSRKGSLVHQRWQPEALTRLAVELIYIVSHMFLAGCLDIRDGILRVVCSTCDSLANRTRTVWQELCWKALTYSPLSQFCHLLLPRQWHQACLVLCLTTSTTCCCGCRPRTLAAPLTGNLSASAALWDIAL